MRNMLLSLLQTESVKRRHRFLQSNAILRLPGSERLFWDQVVVGNHGGSPAALNSSGDELRGESGLSGGRQPAQDAQAGGSQADSFGVLRIHEPQQWRNRALLTHRWVALQHPKSWWLWRS